MNNWMAKEIQSLEQTIAQLLREKRELIAAADRYSDRGHDDLCSVNFLPDGVCTCGLAELEALMEAAK